MFGFFKKAKPDAAKIEAFCSWFAANSERIIASVENSKSDQNAMFQTLDEVEAQLALVYRDGYKGEIQFDYGHNPNSEKWELNLYHLNNRFLIEVGTEIAGRLGGLLGDQWAVNVAQ